MNIHKNARLTPLGRERIVRQVASGQTPQAAARAAGVCPRTVRKWVDRYRQEACRIDHRGHIACDSRPSSELWKRLSSW
jgi:transposase-like protein